MLCWTISALRRRMTVDPTPFHSHKKISHSDAMDSQGCTLHTYAQAIVEISPLGRLNLAESV